MPDFELFAGVAAGYDHLRLDALAEHGVAVMNASGIHAPNIAEQAIGYALQHARRLDEARRRQWRHFQAGELHESTVTIVRPGAIGTAVVERVSPFGVGTVSVGYTSEKSGPTDEVVVRRERDPRAGRYRLPRRGVAAVGDDAGPHWGRGVRDFPQTCTSSMLDGD